MATCYLAPICQEQQFTLQGVILAGGKIYTYIAGSTTAAATYTTSTGVTQNANPIILDSSGTPPSEIWLTSGLLYKFIVTDSSNNVIHTYDNLSGINDISTSVTEWVSSGFTPTYVNSTQFSVVGNRTTAFTVNRRLQIVETAGTVYGTITASSYSSGTGLTTVTVTVDSSGSVDSGISSVSYGLLDPTNRSYPNIFPTQTAGDNSTKAATTAYVDQSNFSVGGFFRNLIVSANGSSSNITVTCDEISIQTAAFLPKILRNVSLTINTSTTGANGLDTGTLATSTWYSLWVIYNPTTLSTAGLISANSTTPTLPSGYTYYQRIGWTRTDSSGNKYPLAFKQYGRKVAYVVGASTNVTALPIIASGAQGSTTTPTWVAAAVGNFVPSTAGSINVLLAGSAGNITMAAPNGGYGAYNQVVNPCLFAYQANVEGWFNLESTNIYVAQGAAGCVTACKGWEDNI